MRVALVALLVVLAGCPAVGSQPTPTPPPETYPPGVSTDGVTDAGELGRAHTNTLNDTSYTIVSNRTIRYTNGTVVSHLFVRVELAADRSFFVSASTAGDEGPLFLGDPPASGEFWSNGTVYVRSHTRAGHTTYNEFTPPDNFVGTWRYWRATVPFGGQDGHARQTVTTLFSDVPTRVTDVRTQDGTTVVALAGKGATDDTFAKVGTGPVGNVTVRAEVTESGVVRSLDLSYVTFVNGQSVRVEWTVRYDDVGATAVERPPWFDRAVGANATETPGEG